MKIAHIDCPHCGKGIIVTDRAEHVKPEEARHIWAAFDRMMKEMDALFHRMTRFTRFR